MAGWLLQDCQKGDACNVRRVILFYLLILRELLWKSDPSNEIQAEHRQQRDTPHRTVVPEYLENGRLQSTAQHEHTMGDGPYIQNGTQYIGWYLGCCDQDVVSCLVENF